MNSRSLCALAITWLLTSSPGISLLCRAMPSVNHSTTQRPRPWDRPKELKIGEPAPGWRLKTAEEETVSLADLRGNVVVLDFWANWSGPCHKLTPLFDRLVREYRSEQVRFFTLSIWPDRDFDPKAFLKQHSMASTFLIGTDTVASDYGIWGVPTYYVIDRAGRIYYIHVLLSVDPEALRNRLLGAIEQALQKPIDQPMRFTK